MRDLSFYFNIELFPKDLKSQFESLLRGKSPKERAQLIIENCAHPDYKQLLWDYLKLTDGKAQTPHLMQAALGMHAELAKR